MLIRKATPADAEQIADVHVQSWQTTYRGIIADDYLDRLSVEQRLRNWQWTFEHMTESDCVFIAEAEDGRIVGLASGGRCRESDNDFDGELYAIYLLQHYQRRGVGRELFRNVTDFLRQIGCSSMMLWVLADNPSLTFYLAQGGHITRQQNIRIGEEELVELAIGWDYI
ncbi:L-amino acid N-acyltransferase YncA [Paenibacillus taihuensis]|uniref:L-amino acid N-acyltransferase YncA n=1 Tax=Paenibacillus taihuensis TaxID=1156355 RepID=A0A3D9R3L9_9BACL|nr:GNAT family N-acetyltransferase [Paenibacillus taihuensis]REE69666.1 L-amino acid N-acyltransferase YncA [Paenibacillus taihuensis]